MSADRPPLVAPFQALRYAATDRLDRLLSPPYDVISSERRAALAAQDPHNIVNLILPEADGDKYAHAASLLSEWRAACVVARDEVPSVYVLRQEFTTPDGARHARTGVIAGLRVESYDTRRVLPHERTHRGPKEDRLALSRATSAMLESIFVLTRDDGGRLLELLQLATHEEPAAHALLDDVEARLWRVSGERASTIATAAGRGAIYIADGHHRFETANVYRAERPEATRIPALVVPVGDPGLVVLPTHRLVAGNVREVEHFFDEWTSRYRVEPMTLKGRPEDLVASLPRNEPACVVVLPDGSGYRLTGSRGDAGIPAIAALEDQVIAPLKRVLGGDVSYSASAQESIDRVADGGCVAVLVPPTPLDVVLAVSDEGGVMPPKSTYFAPKVPSGLVIMQYAGE